MKIRKLTIDNYRCFKHFEIDFAPGITVLIGKNGSGKTSLINAIKHAVSFIFTKDSAVTNLSKSLSASASNLNIIGFNQLDAHFEYNEEDSLAFGPQYPISISCRAEYKGDNLPEWKLQKNSLGGKLYSTLYKEAYVEFSKKKDLPVLAVFSDSYPHIQTNLSNYAKNTLKSGKSLPVNFGFYQWDAETACTEVWEGRFINTWKEISNLEQSHRLQLQNIEYRKQTAELLESLGLPSDKETIPSNFSPETWQLLKEMRNQALIVKPLYETYRLTQEVQYVVECLKTFSKPISEANANENFEIANILIRPRYKDDYIELQFADGREILFAQLPAGYRRLFSIVLDISYRSYIIKGWHTELFTIPLKVEDVNGIVIIDEIDLHLHPSLEQEVLQRFQRTFPNIQFIVSTHSPLVITNLKTDDGKNKIVQMVEGQSSPSIIPDIYGIDYNYGLTDIMETPARNSEIRYLTDSILRLYRRGNQEKADTKKEELKKLVGKNRFNDIVNDIEKTLKS
jgi:predicted ATP-binding protein involved in virulence